MDEPISIAEQYPAKQRRHFVPYLLNLQNSGGSTGPHRCEAGHAAFAFSEEKDHVRH